MINKLFTNEKFVKIEGLLENFDCFKNTLDNIDESKLDEVYFSMKSIINDYKTTMVLITKINHLLNVNQLVIIVSTCVLRKSANS